MKRLILLRHAKSSWKHPNLPDFQRPLNKRGKSDAPAMAQRMLELQIKPDLIISSPAKRALTTANIMAEKLGFDAALIIKEPEIYEGSISTLLYVIRNLDSDATCVMIVGHNPGFTYLANQLTGTRIDNVPTCGIVCVDFKCETWFEVEKEHGKLVFFDFPKNSSGPIKLL